MLGVFVVYTTLYIHTHTYTPPSLLQVSYVKGGLPAWVRAGLPTTEGPEDLEAVPALRPGADDDEAGGSDDENGSRVLGAFKLPQFKLPQLSFGSAARR